MVRRCPARPSGGLRGETHPRQRRRYGHADSSGDRVAGPGYGVMEQTSLAGRMEHMSCPTPQEARDALGWQLRALARRRSTDPAAREEFWSASAVLETERRNEMVVAGRRFRVVRADQFCRHSGLAGPEPPRRSRCQPHQCARPRGLAGKELAGGRAARPGRGAGERGAARRAVGSRAGRPDGAARGYPARPAGTSRLPADRDAARAFRGRREYREGLAIAVVDTDGLLAQR